MEEVETAIYTLLTVLEHFHPEADMESNFTEEAVECNLTMKWDEDKKCTVDTTFQETSKIQKEEELPGFIFDQEVLNKLNREVDKQVMSEDSDLVSMFRPVSRPNDSTIYSITRKSSSIGSGTGRILWQQALELL